MTHIISWEDPQPNVPLIRKVWDWVQEQDAKPIEESQWVQSSWYLSENDHADYIMDETSTLCELDGFEYTAKFEQIEQSCGTAYCIAGYVGYLEGYDFSTPSKIDAVPTFAREVLGLFGEEADALFEACNGIDTVHSVLSEVMDRAGDKL